MPSITVNGVTYTTNGSGSVCIHNGRLTVGGDLICEGLSGVVRVDWSGPVAESQSDTAVSVAGSVSGSVRAGTSVNCGSVGGDVKAGTAVNCGEVAGSVKAGTAVNCTGYGRRK